MEAPLSDYKILEGKGRVFRIFGYLIFASHISDNRGWFRIFGYGVSWKHVSIPMMFSERYGYKKTITIREYRYGFIKPIKSLPITNKGASMKDIQEVIDAMDRQNEKS